MKGYRLFLAYYTFITSLALFIWSIFYAPKPQNFLLTALIVPTSLYFWLLIGGVSKPPSSTSENQGKNINFPLIVLMTLFVSSFSIFVYSTANNRSSNSELVPTSISKQIDSLKLELKNQNKVFHEETVVELSKLKNQLINLKSAQKVTENTEILGDITALAGTVTIKDKIYPTVNVYSEKSTSSAVLGKAEFGKTYTFIEKNQDWYLILIGTKEGFINSKFVKEVLY